MLPHSIGEQSMLFSLGHVLGLLCNPAESTQKAYSIPQRSVLADAEEDLMSSEASDLLLQSVLADAKESLQKASYIPCEV